ncbi:MAG: hypothetical protein SOY42_05690 [Clostridium sp.]|nr:hypothetical protein [Clostridium sp.]
MSGICIICGRPLNESQYSSDKQYKSCPRCSERNGKQHVYYPYPKSFGVTDKRASKNSPEGAQSYCTICRGRGINCSSQILCKDIVK